MSMQAGEGTGRGIWSRGSWPGSAVTILATAACGGDGATEPEPQPEPLTVSVEVTGHGAGRVVSQPAGISCGEEGAACQAEFDPGTVLTLTAEPEEGSHFEGWTGACTGTGSCSVDGDGDVTVGAEFENLRRAAQEVTPEGGTVTSRDGSLELEIPEGALSEPVRITVEMAEPDEMGSAFDELAEEYGIRRGYRLGPAGLEFAVPVEIRLPADGDANVSGRGPAGEGATAVGGEGSARLQGRTSEEAGDGWEAGLLVFAQVIGGEETFLGFLWQLALRPDFSGTLKLEPDPVEARLDKFAPEGEGWLVLTEASFRFQVHAPAEVSVNVPWEDFRADLRSESGGQRRLPIRSASYQDISGFAIEAVPGTRELEWILEPHSLMLTHEHIVYRCREEGTHIFAQEVTIEVDGERPGFGQDDFSLSMGREVECIQPTLTVSLVGEGEGRVTSEPEGIDCGTDGDSCEAQFEGASQVTLTAEPEEGSVFVGWVDSEGEVLETETTVTVEMTEDGTVRARFEPVDPDGGEVDPDRAPQVVQLRAFLSVPVTTYRVDATDPAGGELEYEWTMVAREGHEYEECGDPRVPWTQTGQVVSWSHGSEDGCPHMGTNHSVDLTVTVTSSASGLSVRCEMFGSDQQTINEPDCPVVADSDEEGSEGVPAAADLRMQPAPRSP